MRRVLHVLTCVLLLHPSLPVSVLAQDASHEEATPSGFSAEQLDALLAPIALYPDTLLTQTLMATTFPLQVVEAGRWLDDPAHKALSGDALAKALQSESWDPSVKSLVPFPQVVATLNANLEWTQQLGYAFADQQAAVMDSIQRLRRQAQEAGSLQSTPQQVVQTEHQTITIEPAQPNVVYVPSYSPTAVYGAWPYPAYPPVVLPPPPGYAVGTALATGLAFGAGVAITAGLWGWARPAWGGGYVNVNVNRYNNINVNRQHISSNVWQANRVNGRPAGLQRPPAGPVGRPARANGLPANAVGRQHVSVPQNLVNRPNRPGLGAGTPNRPAAGTRAASRTPQNPGAGLGNRDSLGRAGNRPAQGGLAGRPSAPNRPTAFSSFGEGHQAAQYGARGGQSRAFGQTQRQAGGFGGHRPGGMGGGGRVGRR